jgi:predicted negative regulator of RcsB-dependent stress response
MSQDTQHAQPAAEGGMAAKLPEELLPVYDWYRTQGRQLVMSAALLLLVALGTAAFLRYRANQASLASAALMTTESVEGFENLERQYGSTRVGPLIRLGLAKAYFNAGNIQGARKVYEAFLKRHPRHAQADTARIGLAATLEEEQAFAEAGNAFEAFAREHPDHYLYPVAILGLARCLAAQQRKDDAFDQLDRLIVTKTGTPWEEMARDLRGVIARFEGFKSRSIFDQMGAVAKTRPAETAPSAGGVLDALPVTATDSNTLDAPAAPAEPPAAPAVDE